MVKKMSFEKQLEHIETIVSKLEAGNISLEDSLKLYEEGAKKITECAHYLDTMEKRIDIVLEKNGKAETMPMDME